MKKIKNTLLWLVPLVLFIILVIWIATLPRKSDGDIISRNGVHWHPNISIEIDGKNIKIPKNIGIGAVHNPIHTHKDDGTIHMEYNRSVRDEDTEISRFFKVWGKDFSSQSIMGNNIGENGSLEMFVNGKKNFEFEKYKMKNDDKIKIVFKSNKATSTPVLKQ